MAKTFRAWDVEQSWLLPPSVHELVPAAHPAHLGRELVRTELDLGGDLRGLRRGARVPAVPPRDDDGAAGWWVGDTTMGSSGAGSPAIRAPNGAIARRGRPRPASREHVFKTRI